MHLTARYVSNPDGHAFVCGGSLLAPDKGGGDPRPRPIREVDQITPLCCYFRWCCYFGARIRSLFSGLNACQTAASIRLRLQVLDYGFKY